MLLRSHSPSDLAPISFSLRSHSPSDRRTRSNMDSILWRLFLLRFLRFVAGAAIVIGLQQLKGLFGITRFNTKTEIVAFTKAV
ncbi:unnamed protein product [Trifolium pratense]|uniref:Uncharacterized protein n=1 Tax=Trifolium pratense TaxID=57577 RepID=A0ACB0IHG9_TRIPR|nr:unnamed protein product [Trifolium pratense]